MSNNNDDPHDYAHALAGLLQETIEDYLEEVEAVGGALPPYAVYLGVQIVSHGWARFLGEHGADPADVLGCSLQGVACGDKLVRHLAEHAELFLGEPNSASGASNDPGRPLVFVRGPTEEC